MKNGKYELVVAPNNYPGRVYRGRYCYEHHLVWWQHYGETIGSDENIHHVNGDCRDNRIENLCLMRAHEHNKEHGKKLIEKYRIKFVCGYCGCESSSKGND